MKNMLKIMILSVGTVDLHAIKLGCEQWYLKENVFNLIYLSSNIF